ncbi:hypothetical protein KIL84_004389, partial [Mauremys mutica]
MRSVHTLKIVKRSQKDPPDQVTVKMKVLSFCHSSRASSPLPLVFFLTCYVRKMES